MSVELVPMTEARFVEFRTQHTRDYADDKVRAGNVSPEKAMAMAEDSYRTLLPDGLRTKDHYVFTIRDRDSGAEVGTLWYGLRDDGAGPMAWLYDILIDEKLQRRGYGSAALAAFEAHAKARGFRRIGLHVFGHNPGAQALYLRTGYVVTNINMAKEI